MMVTTKQKLLSYPTVVPVKVEVISREQVFLVVDVDQGQPGSRFARLARKE
jgi:hypothetical protein